MTSRFTDPTYLKTNQYRDSTNLDARVVIHKRFSTNPYGWFNWVFDALTRLPENACILELGCGPGYMWKECAHRIPPSWKITLSDLSRGMLEAAGRNLTIRGRDFKFEQIDAQSIPYSDETFDAVIANHMLYHVSDRKKALSEIKRVLKPYGRLFATTVGDRHLQEISAWLSRATAKGGLTPFSQPFLLENGLEQLQEFFSNVELFRYDDDLRVTEVGPIMAYIHSGIRAVEFSQAELAKVENELTAQLEKDGEILITKDSGLFLVVK
jgi:ubiquinone/menaquinone biosynthesis C-methylase UbiE